MAQISQELADILLGEDASLALYGVAYKLMVKATAVADPATWGPNAEAQIKELRGMLGAKLMALKPTKITQRSFQEALETGLGDFKVVMATEQTEFDAKVKYAKTILTLLEKNLEFMTMWSAANFDDMSVGALADIFVEHATPFYGGLNNKAAHHDFWIGTKGFAALPFLYRDKKQPKGAQLPDLHLVTLACNGGASMECADAEEATALVGTDLILLTGQEGLATHARVKQVKLVNQGMSDQRTEVVVDLPEGREAEYGGS